MKSKIMFTLTGLVVVSSLVFGGATLAADNGSGQWGPNHIGNRPAFQKPAVVGTVSAISGATLTVVDSRINTAYTVDASNATVTKDGSSSLLSAVSVGDTVMIQGTVNGTSVTATAIRDGMMGRMLGKNPGVFGIVASVNGTTLTITSKMGPGGSSGTTYTVDASNTTVTKNGANSSVANIAVGDTVMIQGTVNGTSVTATSIRDGIPQKEQKPEQTPVIQGNGQPVVGGNITAINGTTLTITNVSNITYTIDASNAKVEKAGKSALLSDVAVGDNIIVQGAVNGTSITASSVIDQGALKNSTGNNETPADHGGLMGRFLNGIGGFFHRLFGFF